MHLQAGLDCEEHPKKEEELIRSWPGRLKSDGYERVRIFTLGVFGSRSGPVTHVVPVIVGVGRGIKGVYGGLVLLGIHEHCTPGDFWDFWDTILISYFWGHHTHFLASARVGRNSLSVLRRMCFKHVHQPPNRIQTYRPSPADKRPVQRSDETSNTANPQPV
jgi:hypothetical protein